MEQTTTRKTMSKSSRANGYSATGEVFGALSVAGLTFMAVRKARPIVTEFMTNLFTPADAVTAAETVVDAVSTASSEVGAAATATTQAVTEAAVSAAEGATSAIPQAAIIVAAVVAVAAVSYGGYRLYKKYSGKKSTVVENETTSVNAEESEEKQPKQEGKFKSFAKGYARGAYAMLGKVPSYVALAFVLALASSLNAAGFIVLAKIIYVLLAFYFASALIALVILVIGVFLSGGVIRSFFKGSSQEAAAAV